MSVDQKTLELLAQGKYAPVDPDVMDYDVNFECPKCSSSHFGSYNGLYMCHDEHEIGCGWEGLKKECFVVTKQLLAEELLAARREIISLKSEIDANKYGWK